MNSDGHIIEINNNEQPPSGYADISKLTKIDEAIAAEVKEVLESKTQIADPFKQPKLSRLARKMKYIREQMGILPHNGKS